MLRITTLGRLIIEANGSVVQDFISRKAEALLVYLAVEHHQQPRETLAQLFWSESSQERATASLRMALSNLQQILPSHFVVTRYMAGLNPDIELWLDMTELEQALDMAEAERVKSNIPSRKVASQLKNALSFYQGEFLSGLSLPDSQDFKEWTQFHRERIHNRVCLALVKLAEDDMSRGDYDEALSYARWLTQLQPIEEAGHRLVISILALSNQRDSALAQYDLYARILEDTLKRVPDAEIKELRAQIEAGQFTVPDHSHSYPQVVPEHATKFINRPVEISWIAQRLEDPESRLLSLVGVGGAGKTRLAEHAAAEHLSEFRDGAVVVPLASIQEPDFIAQAISNCLELALNSGRDVTTQLIDFLQDKNVLLVLDNLEHLLKDISLIDTILSKAPQVKILATSLERLNLQSEHSLVVSALEYPSRIENVSKLTDYSAIRLFVEIAQQTNPDFSLRDNEADIVRICQLVEGLPLAIELAASWLQVMTCNKIAVRLEHSLDMLATSDVAVPERQRSFRVVMHRSWELLSNSDRDVMGKLSVFRGGFDLAGAKAVGDASLFALASLIDKSLIRKRPDNRYDMHELIRRYSLDQLAEIQQADQVRNSLLAYILQYSEEASTKLAGAEQAAWLQRTDQEIGNIREAMSWGLKTRQPAPVALIAANLWRFWKVRAFLAEGVRWMDDALSANENIPPETRAAALQALAILEHDRGNYDRVIEVCQESILIWKEVGNTDNLARVLNTLGGVLSIKGKYEEATTIFQQGLDIVRQREHKLGIATFLSNLAVISNHLGDSSKAYELGMESLALYRQVGSTSHIATTLYNLAETEFMRAYYDNAERLAQEALDKFREINDLDRIGAVLRNLSEVALARGNLETARLLSGESLEIFRTSGSQRGTALTLLVIGMIFFEEGNFIGAQAYTLESLKLLGDRHFIILCLSFLACTAYSMKQSTRAIRLFATASAFQEVTGDRFSLRDNIRNETIVSELRHIIDATEFNRLWSEGQAMNLEEAVLYAMSSD